MEAIEKRPTMSLTAHCLSLACFLFGSLLLLLMGDSGIVCLDSAALRPLLVVA